MPRVYMSKTPKVDEGALEKAMEAVVKLGINKSEAAKKFNVNRMTLARAIDRGSAKPIQQRGGQTSLPGYAEEDLASCLSKMSHWGFALTRDEVKSQVQDYVNENMKLDTDLGIYLRKYNKFKDGIPGNDWLTSFMKRFRLSTKLPSTLEKSRRLAASDPNIIYKFYEVLETQMNKLQISDKPNHIWNCDETSLFTDPARTKVVAPIGKKACRTTSSSGRESHTIMAAVSAAGTREPPLIIFKGKNFQSSWVGKNAYPGTMYGKSESGWMVTEVFLKWFTQFCKNVKQRPILFIFDGHSTHMKYSVIKKAMDENIVLLKLPAHTTSYLQPLDVCCFKALNVNWDKKIAAWQKTNHARRITSSEFVDAVGEIWEKALPADNIISGFSKTGIYPLDKSKYDKSLFNPFLLKMYQEIEAPDKDASMLSDIESQNKSTASDNSQSSTTNIYFEQTLANYLSPKSTTAVEDPSVKPKRRRINPGAQVLTDKDFAKEVKKKEKQMSRKKGETISSDDSSDSLEMDNISNTSIESDTEIPHPTTKNTEQTEKINFVVMQANLKVDDYCAVNYQKKFYIGRILCSSENEAKIKFLTRNIDGNYEWPRRDDIANVDKLYIFDGPIKMSGTVPFKLENSALQKGYEDHKKWLKKAV